MVRVGIMPLTVNQDTDDNNAIKKIAQQYGLETAKIDDDENYTAQYYENKSI